MKQLLESIVRKAKGISRTGPPPADKEPRSLYVIVHDYILYRGMLDDERTSAREEIERIRREEEHREILENDSPDILAENMPPPSEDLLVYVVGGYIDLCVDVQLHALQRADYSAKVHSKGCFGMRKL